MNCCCRCCCCSRSRSAAMRYCSFCWRSISTALRYSSFWSCQISWCSWANLIWYSTVVTQYSLCLSIMTTRFLHWVTTTRLTSLGSPSVQHVSFYSNYRIFTLNAYHLATLGSRQRRNRRAITLFERTAPWGNRFDLDTQRRQPKRAINRKCHLEVTLKWHLTKSSYMIAITYLSTLRKFWG